MVHKDQVLPVVSGDLYFVILIGDLVGATHELVSVPIVDLELVGDPPIVERKRII